MLRSPSVSLTEDGENPASSSRRDLPSKEGSMIELKPDKLFNLYIKAISWPSEGRGLLHILSPLLYTNEFKVRAAFGSYRFYREDGQVLFERVEESDKHIQTNSVASIDVSPNGVTVVCCAPETDPGAAEVWEEVTQDSGGRNVCIDDVLRFGSYKVRIVDLVLSDEAVHQRQEGSTSVRAFTNLDERLEKASHHTQSASDTQSTNGPVCRICFEPSEDNHNELLSPCNCSGSLRYIHVDCLKRWLDGQLQVKQFDNGGGSYLIRTIACEICKSIYSKSVYESILIPRPNCPHVIIEDFIPHQVPISPGGSQVSQASSKMHIVPLVAGKPIRVGRSKENDIVLGDISVSRVHATLSLSNGGHLKLTDSSSKFGTLVRLANKIFVPANGQQFRLQIGSCLIELLAAFPNRLERFLPDRFLQERGTVRLVRSKVPSERIVEAEKHRRNRSMSNASPASPAATLNNSFVRSPRSVREALLDDLDPRSST
jgi:hypothetical protein